MNEQIDGLFVVPGISIALVRLIISSQVVHLLGHLS
jgi:hypothetical protein